MREELQQQDVERWLGFITFLCEVFGTMRSSTGEPFRVLVCPIYTCLREVSDPPGRARCPARERHPRMPVSKTPKGQESCEARTTWRDPSFGEQECDFPCFCRLKPGFIGLSL